MKPLATARSIMTWFRFCSASDSTGVCQKMLYFSLFSIILITNLCCVISSMVFVLKYLSTDLNGSMYAFMIVATVFTWICAATIAFFIRHKIRDLFKNLATIYWKCKWLQIEINSKDFYFNFLIQCAFDFRRIGRLISILSGS